MIHAHGLKKADEGKRVQRHIGSSFQQRKCGDENEFHIPSFFVFFLSLSLFLWGALFFHSHHFLPSALVTGTKVREKA